MSSEEIWFSSENNKILESKGIRFKSDRDGSVKKLEQIVNYLGKSFSYEPFKLDVDSPPNIEKFPIIRLDKEYTNYWGCIKLENEEKHRHGQSYGLASLLSTIPKIVYVSPLITGLRMLGDVIHEEYEFKASMLFESTFKPMSIEPTANEVCIRVGPKSKSTEFIGRPGIQCNQEIYKRAEAYISHVDNKNWYIRLSFHQVEKSYWKQVKKELKHIWKS
jgi:hypothetical protein